MKNVLQFISMKKIQAEYKPRITYDVVTASFEQPVERVYHALANFDFVARFCGSPTESDPEIKNSEKGPLMIQKNMLGTFEQRWEWVENKMIISHQVYHSGIMHLLDFKANFSSLPDGSTEVKLSLGLLGISPFGIFLRALAKKMNRDMVVYLKKNDEYYKAQDLGNYTGFGRGVPKVSDEEISSLSSKWEKLCPNRDVAHKIASFVLTAPEGSLSRINAFKMADAIGVDRMVLLEFLLEATTQGFFIMTWQILCPNCKQPTYKTSHLHDLDSPHNQCNMCNVTDNLTASKNVELVFSPAPLVRKIANKVFCATAPENQLHFASQHLLDPFEKKEFKIELPEGIYSFRLLEQNVIFQEHQDVIFNVRKDSQNFEYIFNKTDESELTLNTEFKVTVENVYPQLSKFNIIRLSSLDDAVTIDRASSIQAYRNYFSLDAIPKNIELGVKVSAFLFTDIKNSTQMYSELGDSSAFSLVSAHFDILQKTIKANNGAIVKTIGDAVMGVFIRPLDAIKSMVEIQYAFIHLQKKEKSRIIVRMGAHSGASLLVRANHIVDYFGNAVNLTARISHESLGNDMTISESFYHDEEVLEFLNKIPNLKLESSVVKFKGILEDKLVYRISF